MRSTTAYRWLSLDSHPSLRTLWSAVIKSPNFSARGRASPVRLLPGALVILLRKADFAISVFWEVSINTVLPECHYRRTFRSCVMRNVCAGAGTSVSSILSVNSSNHSGRSRKRSSEARLIFFFLFLFWVFGDPLRFHVAGSSLRSDAGLEDVLDESCGGDVEDELVPEVDDNCERGVFGQGPDS